MLSEFKNILLGYNLQGTVLEYNNIVSTNMCLEYNKIIDAKSIDVWKSDIKREQRERERKRKRMQ